MTRTDDSGLRIAYEAHDGVRELIDRVRYTLEGIGLDFDRWDDRHVKGPGMYVAVVTGPTVDQNEGNRIPRSIQVPNRSACVTDWRTVPGERNHFPFAYQSTLELWRPL